MITQCYCDEGLFTLNYRHNVFFSQVNKCENGRKVNKKIKEKRKKEKNGISLTVK